MEFCYKNAADFISETDFDSFGERLYAAHSMLENKSGEGSEFTGWLRLPAEYDRSELEEIKKSAEFIRQNADALIVIGIGGSYLGARAALDFLHGTMYNLRAKTKIFFTGNSISGAELADLLEVVRNMDICVNVISKSGTTTEPAIAFRVFKKLLEEKYGKDGARQRIFATTDRSRGALKTLSDANSYKCFVVPDDIGGRYSVLTAVGLLPIAVSGADVGLMLEGAEAAMNEFSVCDIQKNICYLYAVIRNIMLAKGKIVELFAGFEPNLLFLGEWCKQLFGESEGKNHKGIFPAYAGFSTDLHSLGQYIQDGSRIIFETMITAKTPRGDVTIGFDEENLDGQNYIAEKTMSYVNNKAFLGTLAAHADGGMPVLTLQFDAFDEYNFGFLCYFFEKACAVSGYILGVNPFNQEGVEAYKKNMFSLLGKPGF